MLHGHGRQIIMLVDDNQTNLNMGKNMLRDHYEVFALPSAERLFKFLMTVTPDLILLDVDMPGMNGFDVIKILKEDARYADIPVIFVTAQTEEMDELEGLKLGAVDYVAKPFSAAILLRRIENHLLIKSQKAELERFNNNLVEMVEQKTAEVVGLQDSIVNTVAEIVEFRDVFTGEHINHTQQYVKLLLDYMLMHTIYAGETKTWENVGYIVTSTQLHDLGKVFISDTILNKPGRLTAEEFDIMKTHVVKGVEAIRRMKSKQPGQSFLDCAEIIAATHHEKWDGSGYPAGLKENEIPLLGRLMAIADVYDALTSTRPYKTPFTPEKSAQIIREGSGTHFDPALVEVFAKLEDEFAAVSQQRSAEALSAQSVYSQLT